MNTILSHKLAAVVVGIAAACSAQATDFSGSFSLSPLAYGPGLTQYALFTNFYDGSVAGDTFVDDYYFDAPPPYSDIKASFYASLVPGGAPEVSFSSLAFSIYQPGEYVPDIPLTLSSSAISLSGFTKTSIASGVYVFEVTGTMLVPNAQYAGLLKASVADIPLPAVPEPSVAWLMALGLVGMGVAKRKRG